MQLNTSQVIMKIFEYLPGSLARFQIISRRFYKAVVP